MTLVSRLLFSFGLIALILGNSVAPSFAKEPPAQSNSKEGTSKKNRLPIAPAFDKASDCPSDQTYCEYADSKCCPGSQKCCKGAFGGCCPTGQDCIKGECSCPADQITCQDECCSSGNLCSPQNRCTHCPQGQHAVYVQPSQQIPEGLNVACCPFDYTMVCTLSLLDTECCAPKDPTIHHCVPLDQMKNCVKIPSAP